jgi:hypothetical protein
MLKVNIRHLGNVPHGDGEMGETKMALTAIMKRMADQERLFKLVDLDVGEPGKARSYPFLKASMGLNFIDVYQRTRLYRYNYQYDGQAGCGRSRAVQGVWPCRESSFAQREPRRSPRARGSRVRKVAVYETMCHHSSV